jgi:hypothetical protein
MHPSERVAATNDFANLGNQTADGQGLIRPTVRKCFELDDALDDLPTGSYQYIAGSEKRDEYASRDFVPIQRLSVSPHDGRNRIQDCVGDTTATVQLNLSDL